MKKSFSANIDGRIFNIDEDAYNLLQSYLHQLATAFGGNNDSDEIVNDIEARISEHLAEMCPSSIVNIKDINAVIDIIGHPEDFETEAQEQPQSAEAPAAETGRTTPPPFVGNDPASDGRKLYRDLDDCVFGGVISGIAKYNHWNTTTARLCVVILALLTTIWPCVLAYIIAWIVIQPATNVEQKLRLEGIPVTAASIAKKVRESAEPIVQNSDSFLRILGRIAAAFVGFISGTVGVTCAIGAICALVLMIIAMCTSPEWVAEHFNLGITRGNVNPYVATTAIFSVLTAIIIPCILLLWGACVVMFKVKAPSRNTLITLGIIELIFIVAAILLFGYLDAHTTYYYRDMQDFVINPVPVDSLATDSIPTHDSIPTASAPAVSAATHTTTAASIVPTISTPSFPSGAAIGCSIIAAALLII